MNYAGELGDRQGGIVVWGTKAERTGLVVGEQGGLSTLQEESEVLNRGVGCQKLPVDGRVVGLGDRKLLGVKGKQRLGATDLLWRMVPP